MEMGAMDAAIEDFQRVISSLFRNNEQDIGVMDTVDIYHHYMMQVYEILELYKNAPAKQRDNMVEAFTSAWKLYLECLSMGLDPRASMRVAEIERLGEAEVARIQNIIFAKARQEVQTKHVYDCKTPCECSHDDPPPGNPDFIPPWYASYPFRPIPPSFPVHAPERLSPIILDLDGDGVESVPMEKGVYFDHDGNMFAEKTGWAGADDAFLAWDRNRNGLIDDGNEGLA